MSIQLVKECMLCGGPMCVWFMYFKHWGQVNQIPVFANVLVKVINYRSEIPFMVKGCHVQKV